MAAKRRIALVLLALVAVATGASASIPRSEIFAPAIERFAIEDAPPARPDFLSEPGPLGDRASLDNAALLRSALEKALPASEPIASLAETRIRAFDLLAPFEQQQPSELTRAAHQAYVEFSGESASDESFAHADPVNGRDPTGMADTRLLSAGKPGVSGSVSGTTFDSRGDYFEWLIANGVDRNTAMKEAAQSGLPDTPLSPGAQQIFSEVPARYNAWMKYGAKVWAVGAVASVTGGTATALLGTGTLGTVAGGVVGGVAGQGTSDAIEGRLSPGSSYVFAGGTGVLFNFAARGMGAYEPDVVPQIGTFAPPTVPARGGIGPVLKGQAGVQRSIMNARARGETLLTTEMTIDTTAARTRIDVVTLTPDGRLVFIESKNGPTATLTTNQTRAFPLIETQGCIPCGEKAVQAGLTPGQPIGPVKVIVEHHE